MGKTMTPSLSDERRIQLYLRAKDRDDAELLLELLAAETEDVKDRGRPSYSAMFRILVREELKRRGKG